MVHKGVSFDVRLSCPTHCNERKFKTRMARIKRYVSFNACSRHARFHPFLLEHPVLPSYRAKEATPEEWSWHRNAVECSIDYLSGMQYDPPDKVNRAEVILKNTLRYYVSFHLLDVVLLLRIVPSHLNRGSPSSTRCLTIETRTCSCSRQETEDRQCCTEYGRSCDECSTLSSSPST